MWFGECRGGLVVAQQWAGYDDPNGQMDVRGRSLWTAVGVLMAVMLVVVIYRLSRKLEIGPNHALSDENETRYVHVTT